MEGFSARTLSPVHEDVIEINRPRIQRPHILRPAPDVVPMRRKTTTIDETSETHYFLFPEREWMLREPQERLRMHHGLRMRLHPRQHELLHADPELQDGVPVIGRRMASMVLSRFRGNLRDPQQSITELIRCIELEAAGEHTPRVPSSLAEVACAALDAQRKYL